MSHIHEQNLAATLPHPKANPYTHTQAPIPAPGPDEVLIRVHAVAINPADAIVQDLGIVYPASAYPLIPGSDLAGVVVAVGAHADSTTTTTTSPSSSAPPAFRVGDRVCAAVEAGAFQRFAVAHTGVTAKVPAEIGFAQACVLPLGLCAAAASLFLPGSMELVMPGTKTREGERGEVVLVWGGASSLGSCAVQMLVAAGYRVAATAKGENADYLKGLGAEWAFDYKADEVEKEIVETLKRVGAKRFAGAFSAVGGDVPITICGKIVDVLGLDEGSRVVGTVMPPGMDCPGTLPHGVRMGRCDCSSLMPNSSLLKAANMEPSPEGLEVGGKIWQWLGPAMQDGIIKCKPDPRVVGNGIEEIQKGVDAWRKGVSAEKIVIEIP